MTGWVYTITYSSLELLKTFIFHWSLTKPSRDKKLWTFSVVTSSISVGRVSGKHYSTSKMYSIFIEWEHFSRMG